jgi:phage terminase large subunit-like protein
LALGRRSGKTTMTALAALWDCLLRPDLDALVRPGERRYAVAVATNQRQARLFVAAARSIVERSPILAAEVRSAAENEIVFRNGATIAAFPCTSRGARGWPISCLVMDEAAHFVSETEGPQVAERVFASLAPSTAQFGDLGRIIVSSTPFGQDGFFADLYARVTAGEIQDAAAHNYPSAEMNPTLNSDLLAQERARDPEGFASEYDATFQGGGHAFLEPATIDAAVPPERRELRRDEGVGWVAGLDPAFSSDPFGLAIVGRDANHPERLVLGFAHAWTPARRKAGSFEARREVEDEVLSSVAAVIRLYGARAVTDQYLAPQVVDRLRAEGISVRTEPMTATSKTAAFSELRARLNAGTLDLFDHPPLLVELRRLRTRYRAGSASVVNPRVGGSHGDIAQALALAVWEHDRHGLRRGERGAFVGTDGTRSISDLLGAADRSGSGHLSSGLPSYGGHL